MRHRALWMAATLLALAAVALLGGCGSREAPRKVMLIGLDGLDWRIIDPLMEQGRLPNIQSLVDRGVRVDLRSTGPKMKSPIIWTSIATGKTQQKHGISDFLAERTGEQPLYNSQGWKALPVWRILGDAGHTVGVINWWLSWPAYPVNGFFITERITYAPEDGFDDIPSVTSPPELAEELKPFVVGAASTTDDVIAPFLRGDAWRTTEERAIEMGRESFRGTYAMDMSVLQIAEHMLEAHEQPEFFAVYFQGLDVVCHQFWGQWDPSSVDNQSSEDMIETFGDLIPRYYEHFDGIVGRLLESLEEDTTVIICSDHGFRGPYRSPDGIRLGIWMHRQTGVMIAAGPGIEPAEETQDASVFDITPTVLALLGEPVGRDMDGFVLTELLDDSFEEANPVTYIDTHERERAASVEVPATEEVDDAIREKLRSLGYIE